MAENLYGRVNGFFKSSMEEWGDKIGIETDINYLRLLCDSFSRDNRAFYFNFPEGISEGSIDYFMQRIQHRIAVLLDSKLNAGGRPVTPNNEYKFDVV